MQQEKIPVIVGVTGHRDLAPEDEPMLRQEVASSLAAIRELCGETPVVMLNALAEGADLLCAEEAFAAGMEVCAVLPCAAEEYQKSFDDPANHARLADALRRAANVIIVPDMEENAEELSQRFAIGPDDYRYRQVGIYLASHSHILLALWDGGPSRQKFGGGTADVVRFALTHNYIDRDHTLQPGMLNDCSVLQIHVRRQGQPPVSPSPCWLTAEGMQENGDFLEQPLLPGAMPEPLRRVLLPTLRYNAETWKGEKGSLWKGEDLDDYRTALALHYGKADWLSFCKNQRVYNRILLLVALIGMVVAVCFMLYDDASLTFMIFPCILAIAAVVGLVIYGDRRRYHANYIEYRAFAEALRIQFYSSLCLMEAPVLFNVCDLYAWTQKVDFIWIYKALQAIAAVVPAERGEHDPSEVIDIWVGLSERPKGQLRYHTDRIVRNRNKARRYERATRIVHAVTIAVYLAIFALELVGIVLRQQGVDWFWEGELGAIPCRSLGIIFMGIVTAVALILSSYWGKLSFDRKTADNEKMIALYTAAYRKWKYGARFSREELRRFVREIAREEIVENGIWCSYVADNRFEWNF